MIFKRMKKFRELSEHLKDFEACQTDEQNRRVIRIHLRGDSAFLSSLSPIGVPIIDNETAFFLNYYFNNLSTKRDSGVHIVITGHGISARPCSLYEKAIRNYYKEDFLEIREKIKKNTFIFLIYALVGLSFIATLSFFGDVLPNFMYRIAEVLGWVFVWESVDSLTIERAPLKQQLIRDLKMLESEITFSEE